MAKNLFNSIKLNRPKKNFFDLTHDVKLSLDMGDLVPMCLMEAVPGDKFKISCDSLLRFAPLIAPVMHRMNVTMHYFFVPNRILWPNWEKWITQNETATTAHPTVSFATPSDGRYGKLADYLGIPTPPDVQVNSETVSALPFAAYQMIYNEYYRDQNLIDPVNFTLTDGSNNSNAELFTLRKRAWMHDYFTASLPFAQKGAAVDIPLGTVQFNDDWTAGEDPVFVKYDGTPAADGAIEQDTVIDPFIKSGTDAPVAYDPKGSLVNEPTTINELRRAFKLQEWLERNARGGTRYIESILSHFGVRSSDKRLQRPEYITGVKSPVVISEVLNTTGEDGGLPQGNMSGHGISVSSGRYGDYYCEEHGYIVGIMSVMPITAYQQGVPKHFLKVEDPFQYYWPTFAHIGEQEVFDNEIWAYHAGTPGTFGYVPRYAEYKYMPSRVSGDFRSTLDYWHLGRIFASKPSLNKEFVECDPGKRIFAVESTEDSLYAHVLNKVTAIRSMPKFGNPSF